MALTASPVARSRGTRYRACIVDTISGKEKSQLHAARAAAYALLQRCLGLSGVTPLGEKSRWKACYTVAWLTPSAYGRYEGTVGRGGRKLPAAFGKAAGSAFLLTDPVRFPNVLV